MASQTNVCHGIIYLQMLCSLNLWVLLLWQARRQNDPLGFQLVAHRVLNDEAGGGVALNLTADLRHCKIIADLHVFSRLECSRCNATARRRVGYQRVSMCTPRLGGRSVCVDPALPSASRPPQSPSYTPQSCPRAASTTLSSRSSASTSSCPLGHQRAAHSNRGAC